MVMKAILAIHHHQNKPPFGKIDAGVPPSEDSTLTRGDGQEINFFATSVAQATRHQAKAERTK
jgi:hypothetical protein